MAIFHCSIKLIGRKDGRDAVASAAYRAGERLYDEEYQEAHDYTRKQGVIMREILLPENAPERLKNREVLWNEVQKIESQKNAQFAREIEVAFPVEMTREEQISCVHEYVQTNFVSKGMIVDLAIHDKGNGNPHVHIMLPLRGFDEDKNWMKTKIGCRKRKQYLQMTEMKREEQFLIQKSQAMILKIKRQLSSTAFLYWMKMESKRLESVKAREKNFYGRELPSL